MIALFDDISRTNFAPAAYAEPSFSYLNQSARPYAFEVRDLLEQWFTEYPELHQAELRARFRSPIESHHLGAFFELYLHALLRHLGYTPEVHAEAPDASGKQIDFRVAHPPQPEFFLEATVATDRSADQEAAEARLHQVYDAINRVESPDFFLRLGVEGLPSSPVPGKKLRAKLRDFLAGLDFDEVRALAVAAGLSDLPEMRFQHDDWTILVSVIPKSDKARGKPGLRPIGMLGPTSARIVDNRSALREAVERKATKYGELGVPYVVAVDATTQHLDQIDIMEALFGQEQYVFTEGAPSGAEPEMRRKLDGAWITPTGPKNTRVSAVLIASSLVPSTIARVTPVVYHNPYAAFPCLDVLSELSHAVPIEGKMNVQDGAWHEPFGLPESWPAGDWASA